MIMYSFLIVKVYIQYLTITNKPFLLLMLFYYLFLLK